jgi:dihydroneopterin aldolase
LETSEVDWIRIRDIRVYARHGAHAHERETPQPFDIDVALELDLREADASDDLSKTLDYAALHARIAQVVATTSHALLERLGSDLLAVIFEDNRVVRAEVTIAKPSILDGATPSITLSRLNPNHR